MQIDSALEETIFSFSTDAPAPQERRRDARHMTILRVGTLIVDGRRELCLIRNISAGGVKAHAYSRLAEGQRVAIELKTNQRTEGTISWVRAPNVGISFDAPIDVEEMLKGQSALDSGWRPRLPRIEIDRMGQLRSGADTYWVAARDISQGGAKLDTDDALEEDSDVVLSLEGLAPIAGVVRWQRDGQCGMSFNRIIPFKELMDWLRDDTEEEGEGDFVERAKGIEPS